jgi:hypothetical protein
LNGGTHVITEPDEFHFATEPERLQSRSNIPKRPDFKVKLEWATHRSSNGLLRQLIEEHIDELEDRYIAEHRLENPDERLTSEQVRQLE